MITEPPQTLKTGRLRVILAVLGTVIGVLFLVGGVYAIRMSDPYVRDVLATPGDVNNGQAIFQLNCAGCHGDFGAGKVGPSLQGVATRRTQIGLIRQITTGKTPPMPKFQASSSEMADLLSYLNTL
ncbi:c-type cytochrome [Lyngbya confervoides]|uniref:C-type cytochrome n=1 Tax=Lyngbya confervoides BDU141951 TaxID=1574623 RepID=A0ABD4T1E4_9CYAN|nr:c-type cytochrome [Lyngbya confervoides]MCM1982260.1 c-type cytochrome [Lyngbya confervoides BDU141951]